MARQPVLERAVMDVLWDAAGWLTPVEVRERLPEEREVAYNTVLTVLVRLWKKGRVERRRRERGYEYGASVIREEYLAARMREHLGSARDRPLALTRFLDELSSSDRRHLRRMLGQQ